MGTEIIFLIEESLDGGFEAKALGYPIFTEADSYEELKESIKDAVQCHFEEENMPKMIRLHLVKEEVIAV
jgi:predicted RNase H-like HicB family nuclease